MTPDEPGAPIEFAGFRREYAEIAPEALARIAEVLASGQVLQGQEVATLEQELAAFCGRSHAVCVGSGTDALFFALLARGVGPGDEVLLPDLSFVATAAAVARLGAKPVFVDIDDSCNLDLARAAEKVTSRTRALLFVNLFGGMADPEAVEAFGRRHGVAVIEDAAQSFGASFRGRPSGGVGDASALSFDPMKVLSAPGSGGAVLTDDAGLAARVRRLRYHGREGGDYVELGYNSQMPSLTAAMLSLKLKRLPEWIARRQTAAAALRSGLGGLPISFPQLSADVSHTWHKFVLNCDQRDALSAYLARCGIPSLAHYRTPLHATPYLAPKGDEDYPRARRHARTTLSLPIHAHLTGAEIDRIIDATVAFFRSDRR